MTATPLSPTSRYIPVGVRQYYWVPSIADKTAPTRAELDAGTDLTDEIAAVSGFDQSTNMVQTADLGHRFTSEVPGRITVNTPTINFYTSDDSDDVRSLLPMDAVGFVVQFPEGDDDGVSGTRTMDVFPVRVGSASIDPNIENPGQLVVMFAVTSQPEQNLLVPA